MFGEIGLARLLEESVVTSNRFVRYLCLALLLAGATATTAAAQRRGATHVRIGVGIGRPVVFAGGFYRPYYNPFFWDFYGWWGPAPYGACR